VSAAKAVRAVQQAAASKSSDSMPVEGSVEGPSAAEVSAEEASVEEAAEAAAEAEVEAVVGGLMDEAAAPPATAADSGLVRDRFADRKTKLTSCPAALASAAQGEETAET
jgi:hypothetical protein